MRPVDIKYALATAVPRPVTQTEVALACGVVKSMVYDVIHGNRRNQRVEHRIVCITGKAPAELWPQWYGPAASRAARPDKRAMSQRMDALTHAVGS